MSWSHDEIGKIVTATRNCLNLYEYLKILEFYIEILEIFNNSAER